jgi:hypothetical protein
MDILREEIIEAQKARADLIKWKLILVAGLGSAGLGLNGDSQNDMILLLCLIPFVCVYVDLAARHLNLRMHVIAEFVRTHDEADKKESTDTWPAAYEDYVKTMEEKRIFVLETIILKWSTLFLSILVIVAGIVMCFAENLETSPLFGLSGLFGIGASYGIDGIYQKKRRLIDESTTDMD